MMLLCLPICWFSLNLMIFSCLDIIIYLYRFFENILFEISLSKPIEIGGLSSLEALNPIKDFLGCLYFVLKWLIFYTGPKGKVYHENIH